MKRDFFYYLYCMELFNKNEKPLGVEPVEDDHFAIRKRFWQMVYTIPIVLAIAAILWALDYLFHIFT